MVIAGVTDVSRQGGVGASCHRSGRVRRRIHGVQVAVGSCDRGRRAGVRCEVVDGRDSRCDGRRDRRLSGELGAFAAAGRQKVSQLRLVPPVHSLRRRLRW